MAASPPREHDPEHRTSGPAPCAAVTMTTVTEQLRRVNRAHLALRRCNQALVRAHEEAALLNEVCRIIVEAAGYRLCWVGYAQADEAQSVRPVAQAGYESGYLETVRVTWADNERGRGPAGTAIRTRQPSVTRDAATDPQFAPWREQALRRGYASVLGLPLVADSTVLGALTIYASEADAFDEEEVELLLALANDLAYGVLTLRTRAEHARAVDALRQASAELERRVAERTAELERRVASECRAHQALKDAQARLVQSEKLVALGQLVAGVAHEINNPLAFALNNLAVLHRDVGALAELLHLYQKAETQLAAAERQAFVEAREYAERLDVAYTLANVQGLTARSTDGLRRIERIIRDLRAFARLDDSDLQEADLNAGIEFSVGIVRVRAARREVSLETELGPLPPVLCYPAKINQVVLNLLVNAIDACPAGGTVTVRSCATADGVAVHVVDTGMGIDPAIHPRIFDPFFTTKPPGQGQGLGLSISHGIVADHGGRIEVESTPGRGAHFTVYLPRTRPAVGP